MVMGLANEAEAVVLSVTVMPKGKVPAVVGVPERMPVLPAAVKLRPAGTPTGVPQE